MIIIHRKAVFQPTHAVCSEHICVKDAIIRYPMIYGSLFHWRLLNRQKWRESLDLVIPTISQDCPNLEFHVE